MFFFSRNHCGKKPKKDSFIKIKNKVFLAQKHFQPITSGLIKIYSSGKRRALSQRKSSENFEMKWYFLSFELAVQPSTRQQGPGFSRASDPPSWLPSDTPGECLVTGGLVLYLPVHPGWGLETERLLSVSVRSLRNRPRSWGGRGLSRLVRALLPSIDVSINETEGRS